MTRARLAGRLLLAGLLVTLPPVAAQAERPALAQAGKPLRVVIVEGRTPRNYTSGREQRVLDRQIESVTRVLAGDPGYVLTYSAAQSFGSNPRLAERVAGLWADDYALGRLDVPRAQAALRPVGAHLAVGLYFDPGRGSGGETTVHVLDVASGAVFRARAPAGGEREYLGALARALGEARRAR